MSSQPKVSFNKLFPEYIDRLLKPFINIVDPDIRKGMKLTFEIDSCSRVSKKSPILQLAKPEDAKEITDIYKEVYEGTYLYKEMEDEIEVRKMIESSNYCWIIFKDKNDKVIGCFTYQLDFKEKRGYMRGLMFKKQYQGNIDAVKATIGSMIGIWSTYKDEIFLWYCENRTAHAKSQYIAAICGIKPIAFFPNKDIFYNEVESDIMCIIYDKKALNNLRRKDWPKIIPGAVNCYLYSIKRYELGPIDVIDPIISLDPIKLDKIREKLKKKFKKNKFGYETITLTIENSESFFKFLYTHLVQNFEKVEYKVNSLEELFIFIQEFKSYARELKIRYYEVFVSAYKPTHQKLFYNAGLRARGYIPSWKFNKNLSVFEDHILFNYFKGKIEKNIQLIPESKTLLKFLKEL